MLLLVALSYFVSFAPRPVGRYQHFVLDRLNFGSIHTIEKELKHRIEWVAALQDLPRPRSTFFILPDLHKWRSVDFKAMRVNCFYQLHAVWLPPHPLTRNTFGG